MNCIGITKLSMRLLHQRYHLNDTKRSVNFYIRLTIQKNNPENKDDKCFKVNPLLEAVRANCNTIEPEANHSIDEQIIPAKTRKRGGFCQYNPKVPHKWGLKNLVRAGESGIIYDFFYRGKNSTDGNSCSADAIVLKLPEGTP